MVARVQGLGRQQVTGNSCTAGRCQELTRRACEQVNSIQAPLSQRQEGSHRLEPWRDVFGHVHAVSTSVSCGSGHRGAGCQQPRVLSAPPGAGQDARAALQGLQLVPLRSAPVFVLSRRSHCVRCISTKVILHVSMGVSLCSPCRSLILSTTLIPNYLVFCCYSKS